MPPPLNTACEHCGARHAAPAALAGKRVRCRKCGRSFHVPDLNIPLVAPPESAPPRQPNQDAAKTTPKPPPVNDMASRITWNRIPLVITACSLVIIVAMIWGLRFFFADSRGGQPERHSRERNTSNPGAIERDSEANRPSLPPDDGVTYTGANLVEHGYRFRLNAAIEGGGNYSLTGTTVIAEPGSASVEYYCGIAMPRRWVIVPASLASESESLTVVVKGKAYPAKVHKVLKGLGFALLSINRDTSFPRPICDQSDSMGTRAEGLTILYRDAGGHARARQGMNVSGGRAGQEYYILWDRPPTECLGGVVIAGSHRIGGLVTAILPDRIAIRPWSVVASGWDQSHELFDYDTLVEASPAAETRLEEFVVTVIAQKATGDGAGGNRMDYLFSTSASSGSEGGTWEFGSATLPERIENSHEQDARLEFDMAKGLEFRHPYPLKTSHVLPTQIPFFIGPAATLARPSFAVTGTGNWETESDVLVRLAPQMEFRHRASTTHANEFHWKRHVTGRVKSTYGDAVTIEQDVTLRPGSVDDINDFDIRWTEVTTTNTATGWVSRTKIQGEFIWFVEGRRHRAKLDFEFKPMSERETKACPTPWRPETPADAGA